MQKKKCYRIFVFIATFLLLFTCFWKQPTEAEAKINPASDVLVDYINETLTVKTTADSVIYFTDEYNADLSKWDVCEVRGGKATFDISWVKAGKTVRLYLCGDVNQDIISKDIAWQEELKVVFTGTLLSSDITEVEQWRTAYAGYPNFSIDTGYFIFTVDTDGRAASYFDLKNIEWRKGDAGVWRPFSELDLKEMNIRGISLAFRIKAVNDTASKAGNRNSTVSTVKIVKLASSPNSDINTDTMEVSVKNGQEISLDKVNWILIPDYNKKLGQPEYLIKMTDREKAIGALMTSSRIAGVSVHKLLGIKGNSQMDYATLNANYPGKFVYDDAANPTGIILYVRTAGSSSKAASKITEIVIPLCETAKAKPQVGALRIENTTSQSSKAGITITNLTTEKYQVAVITPEDYAKITDKNDINVTEFYWNSVKGGKVLKLTKSKVPQGSYLMYRLAGEDGNLPSNYIFIDQPVDYTPVVTPTPSPSPVPTSAP